jgi:hypothetical protein
MFNKKFYLVGLAVLLSVSLIVIGCEGPAGADGADGQGSKGDQGGTGSEGKPGANTPLPSGGYTVDQVNDYVEAVVEAMAAGGSGKLILGTSAITGPGTINFGKDTEVAIDGALTTTGGPVYLVFADAKSVKFGSAGAITLGAGDVVIGTPEQALGARVGGSGSAVETGDPAEATGPVAVENYPLGSDELAIPAGVVITVFGELTVNSDSKAPVNSGAQVIALGTVALAGDNKSTDTTAGALLYTNRVDISNAEVVTKGVSTVAVTLPSTVANTRFTLKAADTITVNGVSTITSVVNGDGKLVFGGTVNELTANITGTGHITFAYDNGATPPVELEAKLRTGSDIAAADIVFNKGLNVLSGTVTLKGKVGVASESTIIYGGAYDLVLVRGSSLVRAGGAEDLLLKTGGADLTLTGANTTALKVVEDGLSLLTAAIEFDGPVDFGGNLTLAGFAATFGDATTFTEGNGLVLTAATTDVVVVEPAAWLGTPVVGSAAYSKVLSNEDVSTDFKLTSVANTKLVFSAGRNVTQASSAATPGAHGITLTGKATLGAGATYTVDGQGTLSLTTTSSDQLLLAQGTEASTGTPTKAKLVLTGATATAGAKLTGGGEVVAGETTIAGGTNGWQAVNSDNTVTGSKITISANEIVTSGATTTLVAGADGSGAPLIQTTEATLVLTGGINLNTGGSVKLTGTTNGSTLKLVAGPNPGKLVLDTTTGGMVQVTALAAGITNLQGNGTYSSTTDIAISSKATPVTKATVAEVELIAANADVSSAALAGTITAGTTDAYLIGPTSTNTGEIKKGNYLLGASS